MVTKFASISQNVAYTSAQFTQKQYLATVTVVGSLIVGAAFSFLVRDRLVELAVEWVVLSGTSGVVVFVAKRGLLLLVALAAVLGCWSYLRARKQFWVLARGGFGVLVAYALSEIVKLIVAEPRPCQVLALNQVLTCPGLDDYSWPSNHSVLAGAIAAACIFILPWVGYIAIPIAAAISASRVLGGVHYVHDVLTGLALGITIVFLLVVVLPNVVKRSFSFYRGDRQE